LNHGSTVNRTTGKTKKQKGFLGSHKDLLGDHRERFAFATEAAQIGCIGSAISHLTGLWDERVKEHFRCLSMPTLIIGTALRSTASSFRDDRERTRQAINLAIGTRNRYDIEYRTVAAGPSQVIRDRP